MINNDAPEETASRVMVLSNVVIMMVLGILHKFVACIISHGNDVVLWCSRKFAVVK